jgi:aquaporin Z
MRTVPVHWPEYAIEALCVALFMISATGCAIALQHPASPLAGWTRSPLAQRVPMGLAMGATAAALIYSPLGRRSGAHMNPAVTLTFFRLGKIHGPDAAAYVAAQFAGALAGVSAAWFLFRTLAADPSVNFVATMPGDFGPLVAFAGEAAISFVLMLTVLAISNSGPLAGWTGIASAVLVATFIVFEAPLSGMSMNPARTLAPALFAHSAHVWIYFTAPPLGMLAAAEVFVRIAGPHLVRCAKLHHTHGPCIFHCGYLETTTP